MSNDENLEELQNRCLTLERTVRQLEHSREIREQIQDQQKSLLKQMTLDYERSLEIIKGQNRQLRNLTRKLNASLKDVSLQQAQSEQLLKDRDEALADNRAKDEFMANISHELRTPLNGVLGMLQLVLTTSLDPTQREYIDSALDSGRSLLAVMNDILDVTSLDSASLKLHSGTFNLSDVIGPVIKAFRHKAQQKKIVLTSGIDASIPDSLKGDSGRLRQILFNLVGNAVKFTESGSVSLDVIRLDNNTGNVRLLFSITDSGIGIPDSKLESIFGRFTQVDGSVTRRYQGAGLGLSIVKRLVPLMEGTLSIISEEGKGTSLHVSLPFKTARFSSDVARHSTAMTKSMRLLVVEDNLENLNTMKLLLETLGHRPVCFENGRLALERLRSDEFDAVLVDIQMPGLNGMDITRHIRSGNDPEIDPAMPVLAVTALAMPGDRERFLAAGIDEVILKPIEITTLINALELAAHTR